MTVDEYKAMVRRKYNKTYYEKHKAELQARVREWRKNNPELAREQNKKYLQRYWEKKTAEYNKAHPEEVNPL